MYLPGSMSRIRYKYNTFQAIRKISYSWIIFFSKITAWSEFWSSIETFYKEFKWKTKMWSKMIPSSIKHSSASARLRLLKSSLHIICSKLSKVKKIIRFRNFEWFSLDLNFIFLAYLFDPKICYFSQILNFRLNIFYTKQKLLFWKFTTKNVSNVAGCTTLSIPRVSVYFWVKPY